MKTILSSDRVMALGFYSSSSYRFSMPLKDYAALKLTRYKKRIMP